MLFNFNIPYTIDVFSKITATVSDTDYLQYFDLSYPTLFYFPGSNNREIMKKNTKIILQVLIFIFV